MTSPGRRGLPEKRLLWCALAVLLLAMLMQLAVNLNLTVYSDDYWYGTFFQDGPIGFLRHTWSHYQNTNGRVYVHILIPILLLADTKLFALLSPVLTALIFLLGLRVQNARMGAGALLLATALALLSLLGSEIQYLRMSLYWLSAFFNYAFPLIFPLLAMRMTDRFCEKAPSRPARLALCLCALLAGAGTEQCGLVSLILIWGYWLFKRKQAGKDAALYLAPLFTGLGYLTILLAPGSHARMARGIDGGVLSFLDPEVLRFRFFDVMGYLCGFTFWNVLFGCFCLLLALLCLTEREGGKLPRHFLSGFPAAGLVALLALTGREEALAVFTVAYTLYAAVFLLTRPDYRETGLLLLGAGASVMMLLVTTLYYARTFFPCLLLFLAVCWSLLFRLLEKCPALPRAGVCVLLAAVFVLRYIPIYQGYRANNAVVRENLQAVEAARESGELELSIDLDADYRFTMFFEGAYFLSNFLQYYGLPQDMPVSFTSGQWDISGLRVGEKTSTFPVLEKDGELLIPIEFLFQESGNPCEFYWTDLHFELSCGGEDYALYSDGRLMRHLPDGTDELFDGSCQVVMPHSYTYTLLYLSAEDLSRCFGISIDYDAESDEYVFQGGAGDMQ